MMRTQEDRHQGQTNDTRGCLHVLLLLAFKVTWKMDPEEDSFLLSQWCVKNNGSKLSP